jgi:hypothetical protein
MIQKLYPNAFEKAKEIAKYLDGFRAEAQKHDGNVSDRYAYLIGENDEKFGFTVITYGSQMGKLEISGDYPKGPEGEYLADSYVNGERMAPPRISVNGNRPGDKIAKDIERRFLPEYRVLLAKVKELKASREAYKNKYVSNARELVNIYGDRLNDRNNGFRLPLKNINGYGEVESIGADSCNILLRSVSIPLARKILSLLAEYEMVKS